MKLEVKQPPATVHPKEYVITLNEAEAAILYRGLGKSSFSFELWAALDELGFDKS